MLLLAPSDHPILVTVLMLLFLGSVYLMSSSATEFGENLRGKKMAAKEHLFTLPQAIIKYRFLVSAVIEGERYWKKNERHKHTDLSGWWGPEVPPDRLMGFLVGKTEKKLREIFQADPDADIKKYESTLGIEVISQDKITKATGSRAGIYT